MLKGKVAIVTGASRGIGRAVALKYAQLGANVVVNYVSNVQQAEQVVHQIKNYGSDAISIKCDISDFNRVKHMVKQVVERWGSIDILVNNAGITKDCLLLRMKQDIFDQVIDVNLKGTFNCIKHVSPVMIKQRSGIIINISSIVALTGNPGQTNYTASKAGVIGMTKTLAKELGKRGIRVNAVAPGFIRTDMTEVLNDKLKRQMLDNIPLGRFGEVEDVADVCEFLASEKARYITGQVINVDGGLVM